VDLFTILASDVAVEPGDIVLLCNFRVHSKLLKRCIRAILTCTGISIQHNRNVGL
jgi:hypothetical protein